MVHLTVCYYHVMYVFQSESALYNYLKVQKLPDQKQVQNLKFK